MPFAHFTLTDKELVPIHTAMEEAGKVALSYFQEGARTRAAIHFKGDFSPVTEADIAVDKLLQTRLMSYLPQAGWLSEESVDEFSRLERPLTWIVDPIDGTRAFAEGRRDWAISVALVYEGAPIAGLLWAPALDVHYEAITGKGARKNGQIITVSQHSELTGARIAGPPSMLKLLIQDAHAIVAMPREPSLALRVARVADATLDAGLATGNAHDWDIAAADIILQEAGGKLSNINGDAVRYNLPEPVHDKLICANSSLIEKLINALR